MLTACSFLLVFAASVAPKEYPATATDRSFPAGRHQRHGGPNRRNAAQRPARRAGHRREPQRRRRCSSAKKATPGWNDQKILIIHAPIKISRSTCNINLGHEHAKEM